jgi:hypothetical protein
MATDLQRDEFRGLPERQELVDDQLKEEDGDDIETETE